MGTFTFIAVMAFNWGYTVGYCGPQPLGIDIHDPTYTSELTTLKWEDKVVEFNYMGRCEDLKAL